MNVSLNLRSSLVFFIIAILLSTTSCKPLDELGIKNYPVSSLSISEYKKLNGIYSDKHISIEGKLKHSPYSGFDELENLSLLDQLFLSVPEKAYRGGKGNLIPPEEKWVKMEFNTAKKATISLFHNDTFLFAKKIHGKMKDGYFYTRPKIFILPFIVVFGYNFQRTRIGISGENLIVDYSVNRWGYVIIAGSSDKGYVSSVYKSKWWPLI